MNARFFIVITTVLGSVFFDSPTFATIADQACNCTCFTDGGKIETGEFHIDSREYANCMEAARVHSSGCEDAGGVVCYNWPINPETGQVKESTNQSREEGKILIESDF